MIVRVVPMRPIPGILPKNKWISSEGVYDLNKAEIIRCSQYGSVYDEDNNLVDSNYFSQLKNIDIKIPITDTIKIDIVAEEPLVQPEVKKEYSIIVPSCVKDDDYIILTTKFNTDDGKISGNMYGLFSVSGKRPTSLEYKNDNEWVKFNNKFMNTSELEDGHEFIFRIKPNGEGNIKYRISIKEGNEVLAKLDSEIQTSKL